MKRAAYLCVLEMKISVIIPSYKPQAYLQECLDSVCAQTFPKEDFEVIIVLNGCCDPYDGLIREYMASHPEVRWNYIQTDQGGVSNARNIALDVSKGEYITFIDDDDYVSPSYLEELYDKADRDTVSLCYPMSIDDKSGKLAPFYITADYEKWSGKGSVRFNKPRRYFNGPVYKLIHKEVIGNRRYDIHFRIGEDLIFMFLISDKFRNVAFTSRNAVYYRRFRENSATATQTSAKEVFANAIAKIKALSKIYFSGRNYRFGFYFTLVRGTLFVLTTSVFKSIRRSVSRNGLSD